MGEAAGCTWVVGSRAAGELSGFIFTGVLLGVHVGVLVHGVRLHAWGRGFIEVYIPAY